MFFFLCIMPLHFCLCIQSVQGQKFDNISAIHDLLVDRIRLSQSSPSPLHHDSGVASLAPSPGHNLPVSPCSQSRKSSITTGWGGED